MTKFNYIYFKKDKKLRILNSKLNSKLTVVFLHGLKSDMEGKKPLFLNRYCKKNKVNFLSLEYAGHGKSYGKFENGTISQWRNNVKFVIRKIIKKEKADLSAVMVALDREEKDENNNFYRDNLNKEGIKIFSIAKISELT